MFFSLGQMPAGMPSLVGAQPAGRHHPVVSRINSRRAAATGHRPASEQTNVGTHPDVPTRLGHFGRTDEGLGARSSQDAASKKQNSLNPLGATFSTCAPEPSLYCIQNT